MVSARELLQAVMEAFSALLPRLIDSMDAELRQEQPQAEQQHAALPRTVVAARVMSSLLEISVKCWRFTLPVASPGQQAQQQEQQLQQQGQQRQQQLGFSLAFAGIQAMANHLLTQAGDWPEPCHAASSLGEACHVLGQRAGPAPQRLSARAKCAAAAGRCPSSITAASSCMAVCSAAQCCGS
jgi:hypothetical protein